MHFGKWTRIYFLFKYHFLRKGFFRKWREFLGNYIQSSTKYSQLKIFSKCEYLFRKVELFFFNTGISFSQGKFLLADCEVLACAAGGRDKGASELRRPAPFSLHPIPRHAWRWEVLVLWGGIGYCVIARRGNSVISYQLLVFSCQFQPLTPNSQLSTNH